MGRTRITTIVDQLASSHVIPIGGTPSPAYDRRNDIGTEGQRADQPNKAKSRTLYLLTGVPIQSQWAADYEIQKLKHTSEEAIRRLKDAGL